MKNGDVNANRAGANMVLQWQDKRTVIMLSKLHSCNVVEVCTYRTGEGEAIESQGL